MPDISLQPFPEKENLSFYDLRELFKKIGVDITKKDLRSDNFVEGSAGWIIKQDGTAEFQSITLRRLEALEASDTLQESADTARGSTSEVPELKKEILVRIGGGIRVKFEYANENGVSINAQVYINGVAVGSVFNTSGTIFLTASQDFNISPFDLIQLFIERTGGSGSVACKNFRIYYDKVSSPDETTVNVN